jgi:cyclohexanone monooxygenase
MKDSIKDSSRSPGASPTVETIDVVIVGAGFAGIYALYKFRKLGYAVRVLERGDGVGGVWFWNRYPGARCDVESIDYSYGFSDELQQEWNWSERYAPQAEILRYLNHVADRFDLRRDIQLNTAVTALTLLEARGLWKTQTADGQVLLSRFCVLATGPLSVPIAPDVPGLDSFRKPAYFTSQWPKEPVDFTGKVVGLVGTGSSGVQATPVIAAQAKHLYVFQRTPNYSVPAKNTALRPEDLTDVKRRYATLRAAARNTGFGNSSWAASGNPKSALDMDADERETEFQRWWDFGGPGFMLSFKDIMTDVTANTTAADFVRRKIKSIVKDPRVAQRLTPAANQALGCKRICVDTDYFETFNRANVTLVDLREAPIEGVVAGGIKTSEKLYELDVLVLATGFDAMTGAALKINIQGRNGVTLANKWRDGPVTYLGLAVHGFPNLFFLNGPGSPSVTANLVLSSELQSDWIANLIEATSKKGGGSVEPSDEAENEWTETVASVAAQTIFMSGCNSWFVGANIPGKPRLFTAFAGGLDTYRVLCEKVEAEGYRGFEFHTAEPVTR